MSAPAVPPPLPRPEQRPGGNFVTVMGWISVALGMLGVAYGTMQVAMGLFLPDDFYLRMLNPYGGEPPPLPPLMQWVYTNTLIMGLLTLVVSAVFLWVSWALLKRREWGRKGFITLLVLGTLWQFGSIGLLPQILQATLAMQAGAMPPGQAMPPGLESMMSGVVWMGAVVAVMLAALHVWIIWKLCTPAIRAEFVTPQG